LKEIYRLQLWEEACGKLGEIQEADGYCLVTIGQVNVLVPGEFGAKLGTLRGQRISILRTDTDYGMRILDEQS
jgi:hypothetical protein